MEKFRHIGKFFLSQYQKNKDRNIIGTIHKNSIFFDSYEEYKNKIYSLIVALENRGLVANDSVAILSNTRREWHYMDLASLFSRAIVVPIYHTSSPSDVQFIIEHSEAKILVIENTYQFEKIKFDKLENIKFIVSFQKINNSNINIPIVLYEDLLHEGIEQRKKIAKDFKNYLNLIKEDDKASIIYTSGTTGKPKGAVITHKALTQLCTNIYAYFHTQFSQEDTNITWLPLSHIFGRCDSFMPMILGIKTVYCSNVDKLMNLLPRIKPTLLLAVPRIFEKIYSKSCESLIDDFLIKRKIYEWALDVSNEYFHKLDHNISPTVQEIINRNIAYQLVFSKINKLFGGKIRFLISGGASLDETIIKFFRNCNLIVLEGYGLTETTGPCTINPTNEQILGTVGIPFGDVEIKFAQDGEILIKTKALLTEYYKSPHETQQSLEGEWFRTGDIGMFNSDGFLKITDRKKDIIITSGGKNVAPQKIENLMKLRPGIANFMAFGDGKKFLIGVVDLDIEAIKQKLRIDKKFDLNSLIANKQVIDYINDEVRFVNRELAPFESIKKVYIAPKNFTVETGELTPSLKIKRKSIEKLYEQQINALYQLDSI